MLGVPGNLSTLGPVAEDGMVEDRSLLSALGELRVDEAGEFGWSLTSMPLSC